LVPQAQASPRLLSQTWQNLIGGGVVHSPYDYDARGLRTQRRDYNSLDTSGIQLAHTVWEYDAQDRNVRQIEFAGTDTQSIVTRLWTGNGIALETTWGTGGAMRYRDTTRYNGSGLKTSTVRLSPTDSIVSMHTWVYDGSGLLLQDTTWQPNGANFDPVVATQTTWQNGRVAWTQEWARSPQTPRWNATQRTVLEWVSGLLASTTDLSGDGSGRVLVDSTSFAHDKQGNVLTETSFDADRLATTRITYEWETFATAIQRLAAASNQACWRRTAQGLYLDAADPLEIVLLDSRGRMVSRWLHPAPGVDLSASLPSGRYFAQARFAHGQSVYAFSTTR